MVTLVDIGLTTLLTVEVLLATLVFCHGTTATRSLSARVEAVAALVGAGVLQPFLYVPRTLPFPVLPWLVLFGAAILIVRLLREVSWLEALVLASLGYCLHHIASGVVVLLSFEAPRPVMPFGVLSFPVRYALLAAVFLLCYAFVGRRFRIDVVLTRSRPRWVAFSVASLVVTIVMGLVFITNQPQDVQAVCYVYDTLCSVLVLALMVSVSRGDRLASSLATIRLLWSQKKAQYELTKENIELINIKCHDIRKRISEAGERAGSLSPETVREISDSVRVYDSAAQTGSRALDVVLTEKRLYCSENGIELSCMADGSLLDGVAEDDLYFLMENVLSNAIEAVERLDDPEQRVINLLVTKSGPLARILEENYFSGELSFKDGLPETTKGDSENHGFGVRSIRHVVEKYHGDMDISARDGVFSLSILLPLS